MEECRILFLSAARRKKQEGELSCYSPADCGIMIIAPPPHRSADVIDLDEARAAAKPRRDG